jgi:multidrug resistance efflux pump
VVILLSVCISVAVLGGVYWVGTHRPPAPPAKPGAALAKALEKMPTGVIRPQHVVSFGSTMTGNIEAFTVEVGEDVFQGQVLARIGAGELETDRQNATLDLEKTQEDVSKAEANVNTARMELSRAEADAARSRLALDRTQKVADRQSTLFRAGATPKLAYEKAVAEYEAATKDFEVMDNALRAARDGVRQAELQVEAAKRRVTEKAGALEAIDQDFENAEVKSTVDGVLVQRKGEIGKPASEAGNDMFTVATDIFALEVVVEPTPDILKTVFPGEQVTVTVLDLQSTGMPGEVKEITQSGQVVVQFNSTTAAIRPGMRAEVRLKQ